MKYDRSMSLESSLVDQILDLYHSGVNVTSKLIENKIDITYEVIELLYDLQAGTYTKNAESNPNFVSDFTFELYSKIRDYVCTAESLLDAGVGEANILVPLVEYFPSIKQVFGVDASWSRLSWAYRNCLRLQNTSVKFAVSDLKKIPLADESVDVSITIHALEPNGGAEHEILQELYRVTRNTTILVEPDFLTASKDQKNRMISLGYIGGLEKPIFDSGFSIEAKFVMENNSNDLNRASVYLLSTNKTQKQTNPDRFTSWVDPSTKDKLFEFGSGFRTERGIWYPQLNDIAFLRKSDSKFTFNPS